MTDSEILEKYHETIETSINRLFNELNIINDVAKQNFAHRFRDGFIIGFHESREEGEQIGIKKVAINFLRSGVDKEVISQNTGLSIDEINKLA